MPIELPNNISYGKVVGRLLLAVGDGEDFGALPDGRPMVGTVTFSPAATQLRNVNAVPPTIINPLPVTCGIDNDGYLIDPRGEKGVWLIASNDPDIDPTNWTYFVTFSLTNTTVKSFSMSVNAEQTQDITTVMPSPAFVGTPGISSGSSGSSLVIDDSQTSTTKLYSSSKIQALIDAVQTSQRAFTHVQTFAAATWNITHNLGFIPGGVRVIDSTNQEVEGNVVSITTTTAQIEFGAPMTGTAYLS